MRTNFLCIVFYLFSTLEPQYFPCGCEKFQCGTKPLNIYYSCRNRIQFLWTTITDNLRCALTKTVRAQGGGNFFEPIKTNWNSGAIKANGKWNFLSTGSGIRVGRGEGRSNRCFGNLAGNLTCYKQLCATQWDGCWKMTKHVLHVRAYCKKSIKIFFYT